MGGEEIDPTGHEEQATTESGGIDWLQGLTAIAMAAIIAFFGGWATINLGVAAIVAIVLFIVAAYWLYQKPLPSAAIGNGLYVTPLLMLLTPVLFYLPTVFDGGGLEAVGGIVALLFWAVVFWIFATVAAGIGYLANRRAAKKLETAS